MNKKITVIELLNKIANNEDLPKKIRVWCGTYKDYFKYDEKEKWYVTYDDTTLLNVIDRLNNQIEILEDNTEEIEELDRNLKFDDLITPYGKNEDMMWTEIIKQHNKIDEIIRYIKRKDKSND